MTGAEFGGVDIDLLADYIGGALAGTPEETVVAERIAEDPEWRTAYESLTGGVTLVREELGRLAPERMPEELATSLDATFRNAEPPPKLTVVQGDETVRPRGRRMRWTAPIAVAAGLIAFVGFGLDYLAGRDSGARENATSTAGGGSAESAPSAASAGLRVLSSGTNYTLGTLAAQPVQTLTAPDLQAPAAPKDSSDRAAGQLGGLPTGRRLQECLDDIQRANAAGTISVQSVDYARFDGSPALIVRFTARNGGWAWASGPACGTPGSGAATLGKVPVR